MKSAPPNILFIITDQQRFDATGEELSPHIRKLAAEGSEFLNAYVSVPVCTPARTALLTGRSTWNHGLLGYGPIAENYEHTLPATLAALGYKTVVVGKNHFGWKKDLNTGVSHGFQVMHIYDGLGDDALLSESKNYDHYDQWFEQQRPGENPLKTGGLGWNSWRGAVYEYEERLHPTAWTGRVAVEQLKALTSSDQPFFLKVSFHRPHSPYDPPERFLNRTLAPKKPPSISTDGWDNEFKDCENKGADDQWCGQVDESTLEFTRRSYLALVNQVDEQIGEILAALELAGASNNTFILFTSDHGDEQMDHYLWKKAFPYQGSVHVPLIIRWPSSMDGVIAVQRGSQIRAVVELRDLFPTFLDVSGHWNDMWTSRLDGRPLTWLMKNTSVPWRQWIDMECDVYSIWSWNALTDGEMKYIFHSGGRDEQLFNISEDPGEQRDLGKITKYEPVLELWRSRLVKQFEAEHRGCGWVCFGHLMSRPWIPCVQAAHYPKWTVRKTACFVASGISWQATITGMFLLAFMLLICTVCCCRSLLRRLRRKKASQVEQGAACDPGESSQIDKMLADSSLRSSAECDPGETYI